VVCWPPPGLENTSMILFSLADVAVRSCIGLIFISGAIIKLRGWLEFQSVLAQYALLPSALVKPASWVIPVVELLVGAALLLTGHVVPAFTASAMLLFYGTAMGINLVRGHSQIDCGCFHGSAGGQRLSWSLVARNAVLAALPLLGVGADEPASMLVTLQGAFAGLVLYLFFSTIDSLWAIRPYWQRGDGEGGRL